MDICISNFHHWLPPCHNVDALENTKFTDVIEWPKLNFVPAMQRRRLSPFAKIALYVANNTMVDNEVSLPIVFSSRHGDLHKTSGLLADLANDIELSPTAFGLSVHNAIPSLYSILVGNKQAINAIAAGQDSFFMALTDAYARLKTGICKQVLLIHADQHLPEIYDEIQIPHAVSMIVTLPITMNSLEPSLNSLRETMTLSCEFEAIENVQNDMMQLPQAVAFTKWLNSNTEKFDYNSSDYAWHINKHVPEN